MKCSLPLPLSIFRAGVSLPRTTAWLVATVIFASGFFIGAISFGVALLDQLP